MNKLNFFYSIIISVGLILIIRLSYLQLFSKKYILNAFNISIKQEIINPERGYIYDKYGRLIVYNQPIYGITITPIYINHNFNYNKFCKLIGFNRDFFIKKISKAKSYSKYIPSTIISYIHKEKFALIQEKLHKYKGVIDVFKRSLRGYNVNSMANILGYTKEVDIKKYEKYLGYYYQTNDFVGLTGVEKTYENVLKGKRGVKYWMRDRKGVITGAYNNGSDDIKSVKGKDIYLTIDLDLQNYAERLMYKKKGGIVVIDPKNGEILALVSSPILDPNLFINKDKSKEVIKLLNNNIDNPFFDRATQGVYPPGSPFKVLTELSGLQMGVVNVNTTFICKHGFRYGQKKINCHCGFYGHPMNIDTAVALSCNNYFAEVYKKIIEKYHNNPSKGLNEWCEIIKSFGLGNYLNNDLSNGNKGRIPSNIYYNKKYPKGWNSFTIISNSIGQGEIDISPIQLANVTAAIANRGFFYTPHIVGSINNNIISNTDYTKPKYTKVKSLYFKPVIRGMEKVFLIGTAKASKAPEISMAGKTGTSQNFIKHENRSLALEDHSIFTLFAPVEKPQIAISVMIENAGFGSRWAGPIASLIAEKHILKIVKRKKLEERMMKSGLEDVYRYIFLLKEMNKKIQNDRKK